VSSTSITNCFSKPKVSLIYPQSEKEKVKSKLQTKPQTSKIKLQSKTQNLNIQAQNNPELFALIQP
jgi:hypothetical protein